MAFSSEPQVRKGADVFLPGPTWTMSGQVWGQHLGAGRASLPRIRRRSLGCTCPPFTRRGGRTARGPAFDIRHGPRTRFRLALLLVSPIKFPSKKSHIPVFPKRERGAICSHAGQDNARGRARRGAQASGCKSGGW